MGHGPAKLLGSIIGDIFPGDVLYLLNSQEPLVVSFITDQAVITNTAEVLPSDRVIRTIFEQVKEFPINWDGFVESQEFEIDISGFERSDFEPGLIVMVFSEDRRTARIETLIDKDEEQEFYLTDDLTPIPFSLNDHIIPTGVKLNFIETEEIDDA